MGKQITSFVLLLCFPFLAQSQLKPILLQNPSFEDEPGFARTPSNWFYCGEIGESPPDIHPYDMFGVTHQAQHGQTYIGMVVRDNNTWEGLSQWLQSPLESGQCYQFSMYAARSPHYQSVSRTNWQLTNYDQPVVLRIWGGNLNCEKKELLAVSPVIESADWKLYAFVFQPKMDFSRLVIEAYYAPNTSAYCGNILVDAASPIMPIDCHSKRALVALDTLQLDVESNIQTLARQIVFSDIDQQLEQHAFFLPSGKLQQANSPLFLLSQIPKNTPDRKLIFSLKEENKYLFKIKSASLERELRLYGLQLRQFRIQKYRPRKEEPSPAIEVFVEVQ